MSDVVVPAFAGALLNVATGQMVVTANVPLKAGSCDCSKWEAYVGSGTPTKWYGALSPPGTVSGYTVTVGMEEGFAGSGSERAKFLNAPSDVLQADGTPMPAQDDIPLTVV